MSKLLLYCAALGLQKISGAKNSQMPTNATAHCAHVLVRGTSASAPNPAMARPLTTSLMVSAPAPYGSASCRERGRLYAYFSCAHAAITTTHTVVNISSQH